MKLEEFGITFKHNRKDTFQAIHGELGEDASLEAVEHVNVRIKELFMALDAEAKEKDGLCESEALEICLLEAKDFREAVLFINAMAGENRCPSHGLIEILTSKRQ